MNESGEGPRSSAFIMNCNHDCDARWIWPASSPSADEVMRLEAWPESPVDRGKRRPATDKGPGGVCVIPPGEPGWATWLAEGCHGTQHSAPCWWNPAGKSRQRRNVRGTGPCGWAGAIAHRPAHAVFWNRVCRNAALQLSWKESHALGSAMARAGTRSIR